MFKKVAFTMYPVKDSTRARQFYETTLGLTRGSAAPNGMWTEYDLPGGGCVALFKSDDIEPSASAGSSSRPITSCRRCAGWRSSSTPRATRSSFIS
jgi:extradiol dioxygenase family protein